ncbi:unnamed protein product [Amoebophrya sp. A120]|nr:unnamed protein product [Amoebophrya sp. A120]|eukprot:GSA120T00013102001.1
MSKGTLMEVLCALNSINTKVREDAGLGDHVEMEVDQGDAAHRTPDEMSLDEDLAQSFSRLQLAEVVNDGVVNGAADTEAGDSVKASSFFPQVVEERCFGNSYGLAGSALPWDTIESISAHFAKQLQLWDSQILSAKGEDELASRTSTSRQGGNGSNLDVVGDVESTTSTVPARAGNSTVTADLSTPQGIFDKIVATINKLDELFEEVAAKTTARHTETARQGALASKGLRLAWYLRVSLICSLAAMVGSGAIPWLLSSRPLQFLPLPASVKQAVQSCVRSGCSGASTVVLLVLPCCGGCWCCCCCYMLNNAEELRHADLRGRNRGRDDGRRRERRCSCRRWSREQQGGNKSFHLGEHRGADENGYRRRTPDRHS